MKTPSAKFLVALVATFLTQMAYGAMVRPVSDVASPQKRQVVVTIAEQIARAPSIAQIPVDLPDPFSFDRHQIQATPAPLVVSELPASDRTILERLTGRLRSIGAINFGGKPILTIGTRRIGVGDTFTMSDEKGRDYDLELVSVDRTTFTLRYRNETFSRSIHQ